MFSLTMDNARIIDGDGQTSNTYGRTGIALQPTAMGLNGRLDQMTWLYRKFLYSIRKTTRSESVKGTENSWGSVRISSRKGPSASQAAAEERSNYTKNRGQIARGSPTPYNNCDNPNHWSFRDVTNDQIHWAFCTVLFKFTVEALQHSTLLYF